MTLALGCGTRQASQETRERIELQLNWYPDAQHGGFYAALVEGYYRDAGLDVDIVPGGPGVPVIQKVTLGRCEFGVVNADQVLLARQQKADVVAFFAAMQDSPRCLMVHAESGIDSFDKLADITLGIGEGQTFANFLKQKLPLKNVRFVSYAGTVAKFLTDPEYGQQAYVFSEPLVAQARGAKPQTLMLSELGFNPYSSVVIASQETWQHQPEMVKKFAAATRKGWQAYLTSPEKTNQAILIDNPELDAQLLDQGAAAIRPLCQGTYTDLHHLGEMQIERWQTLSEQLSSTGDLPQDPSPPEGAVINPWK